MRPVDPVIPLLILTAMAAAFIAFRTALQDRPDSQNTVASRSVAESSFPDASIADTSTPRVEMGDLNPATNVTVADDASGAVASAEELDVSDSGPVMLRITGLKPQQANVLIAVFDSAQAFPEPELRKHTEVVAAKATTLEHTLTLEKNKPLAIAVIQDLDGNRKLTRNIFGIPTEPYGFSNNARGLTGPPDFGQVMFTVDENTGPIEIEMR